MDDSSMQVPGQDQLQQVHLGIGADGYEFVSQHQANPDLYLQEHTRLQRSLLQKCPAHLWHKGSYGTACPRPILVSSHHQRQFEELHEALTTAIVDIVQRWWTDSDARFYERVPLKREEEDLLQWIEDQVLRGTVPSFSAGCLGSWRPDFLVQESQAEQGGPRVENFQITEINARFSFNGFMHEVYGQQALNDMGVGVRGIVNATDPDEVLNGLFGLFQPNLPLHLLKGDEYGIDIHMFIDAVERRIGLKPRLVRPADLRLVPDPHSKEQYKLCCLVKNNGSSESHVTSPPIVTDAGETVEEIRQIGLELHQYELFALEPAILREVSLRCFNDMRTILLVHDKRMLGMVKQELESLVARKVLTPAQAQTLDKGVVETVLPGSRGMYQLLRASNSCPELRYEYILKPVRGGKGAGIVFGDEMTHDEWISALTRLQEVDLSSDGTCVVQSRIIPRLYDLILRESGERVRYPLVGTYHVVNGKLLGLGTWRSSGSRICAVSCGGAWICSVMHKA